MKYFIQEVLEREIERYGDPVDYVEKMWEKNKASTGEDDTYKHAYCYGVSMVLMRNMMYLMKDALEKLDELHPGGENE